MISSEERKQIVAYLYRLIKESPLFTSYTDDRIKEAAVKAEHKAFSSSNTKEEYLNAMNKKIERLKKAKSADHERVQNNISYSESSSRQPRMTVETENNRSYKSVNNKTNDQQKQRVQKRLVYNSTNEDFMNNEKSNDKNQLFSTQPIGRGQPPFVGLHSTLEPHRIKPNSADDFYSQKQQNEYNSFNGRSDQHRYNGPVKERGDQYSQSLGGEGSLYSTLSGSGDKQKRSFERFQSISGHPINNPHNGFDNYSNIEQPVGKDLFTSKNKMSIDQYNSHTAQPPFTSPGRNFDSFHYVNDLNNKGDLRYNENKSFGDSLYEHRGFKQVNTNQNPYAYNNSAAHQPSSFITERGFHSNQNLFDQNNFQESQQFFHNLQPNKGRSVQMTSNNVKYRSREDEFFNVSPSINRNSGSFSTFNSQNYPLPPQKDLYTKRDISQLGSGLYMQGHAQRYPLTSPIGVGTPNKTERSISIGNQASVEHFESRFSPSIGKELKAKPVYNRSEGGINKPVNNFDYQNNFNSSSANSGLNNKAVRSTKTPTQSNLRLERSSAYGNSQKSLKPTKHIEIDECQANELFSSVGSLFDQPVKNKKTFKKNQSVKNNQMDFFDDEPFVRKEPKVKKLDLTVPIHSKPIKLPVETFKKPQSPNIKLKANDFKTDNNKKIVNEKSPGEKVYKPIVKINIPSELKEFMDSNNLNLIETSEENVQQLEKSLERSKETQTKASKIYIEHKNEFPSSNLHQSFSKTNELLEKQQEALKYNVYFLTWRCVDDLLDRLKSVYVDMKVELENAKKKTVNFSEAINNALTSFNNAKKRDEDFVLDLREN